MIKCDENTIEIEGNGMELMAEFASIASHLVKSGCPKKTFGHLIQSGF